MKPSPLPDCPAVFVTAREGARRCMVGEETFRTWSKSGLIPSPTIDRGQIQRWHWPTVEEWLADPDKARNDDPFVVGAANVSFTSKRRTRAAAG